MTNTSDGLSWDLATPISASPRKDGAAEVLGLRTGVELRLEKEHNTFATMSAGPDTSTGGGEHIRGSAISYFEDSPRALERPDADTSTFTEDDSGRLWVDTTGSAYVMNVYDHDDTSFHPVSGVQSASGNFTGAAINVGSGTPVILTIGFVPDIIEIYCPIGTGPDSGFTYNMPLKNLADGVIFISQESTGVNNILVAFKLDGTDVEVYRSGGSINFAASGQCEWVAFKF